MKIGYLTICYLTKLVTCEDGSTKRYYLTKQQNCWTSGRCTVPVRRFYTKDQAEYMKEYYENSIFKGVYEIVSECSFDDISDIVAELQKKNLLFDSSEDKQ